MAELVDALVLGTSAYGVGVQVPSSAPLNLYIHKILKNYYFLHSDEFHKIINLNISTIEKVWLND